jgi:MoxR-like ATPase
MSSQSLIYSEEPPQTRPPPRELPRFIFDGTNAPEGYLPDQGLVDAVNVSLILRQPLLVTGEPGTGKSQLAHSVAFQLGLPPPIIFETKSTAVARDLFYSFDNVGRFRSSQIQSASDDPRLFINYNALGLAIILAANKDEVAEYLPPTFEHDGPRRSVVLIDEVDKAPRDFPNDILNELERFYFRVPELGSATVSAQSDYRPIVIMTSNSEKSLPDAFLRRCVFYNIPFPDDVRLERIVISRLGERLQPGSPLVRDAIAFIEVLRAEESALRKRPGTAELLNWIVAMFQFGCAPETPIKDQGGLVSRSLSTLSKISEDQSLII